MRNTIARIWAKLTQPLTSPRGLHHRAGVPPLPRRQRHTPQQHQGMDALSRIARTQHQPGEFDELAALTRRYLAMRERR
ncbi:hypothetical protein KIK06_03930 [Nocardiopsis sp. EMB25]|uniref:hypothetical protein n=1 Tax=Nocardiopsis sp. EMB25 TaxID=2835867 RepID=UPI00228347A5|nr:hypothetical protein [Nocardiopsis sp. EMB25]MCY9783037.1 hypothetical protein [Nocardiopsis sp. EMB25]